MRTDRSRAGACGLLLTLSLVVCRTVVALPAGPAEPAVQSSSIFTLPPAREPAHTVSYDITVDPDRHAMHVTGSLTGIHAVKEWGRPPHDQLPFLETPSTVRDGRDGLQFAYNLMYAENIVEGAPVPALDAHHVRTFGWSLFTVPLTAVAPDRIHVAFHLPQGWKLATSLGGDRHDFDVPSYRDLRSMAVFAGDIRVASTVVNGVTIRVAVRNGSSVRPEELVAGMTRLLANEAAYFGAPAPAVLFLGMDAPLTDVQTVGTNGSTEHQSATLLVPPNTRKPVDRTWMWQTIAHEMAHTWIPSALGDVQTTYSELGSEFAEGFAQYASYRAAFGAGLWSQQALDSALGRSYRTYTASFESETKSYWASKEYDRGVVSALALDSAIARNTAGRATLSTLLQTLIANHNGPDGVTRTEWNQTLKNVAGAELASFSDELHAVQSVVVLRATLSKYALKLEEDAGTGVGSAAGVAGVAGVAGPGGSGGGTRQ